MKKLIILLMLCINHAISQPSLSNSTDPGVLPLYMLHVNGINTTKFEAQQNIRVIYTHLCAYYKHPLSQCDFNGTRFSNVYNPTDTRENPLISQLLDVFHQKVNENKIITLDDYVMVYMKAKNLNYPINSNEYNQLKQQIQPLYTKEFEQAVGRNFDQILANFYQEISYQYYRNYKANHPNEVPNEFKSVVDLLKSDNRLDAGSLKYVFLIPHSQGNLYANELIDYLVSNVFPANNITSFGIASPSKEIVGDWVTKLFQPFPGCSTPSYVTGINDHVIDSLKVMWEWVLPGNIPIIASGDPMNHSLINTYLFNNVSNNIIMTAVRNHGNYFACRYMQTIVGVNNIPTCIPNSEQTKGMCDAPGSSQSVYSNMHELWGMDIANLLNKYKKSLD